MNLIDWLCILVIASKYCFGQNFNLTKVDLEAYEPSGLRVAIKAVPGIKIFGFHANINREIDSTEPGDIAGDVTVDSSKPTDVIEYVNLNAKLSVGNVINYWIYIQHNFLGYRYSGKWKVTELKKSGIEPCTESITKLADKNFICEKTIIFEDNFNEFSIDESKWVIEQYFPRAPDFEFVVYKKDKNVTFIDKDLLTIRPTLIMDSAELNKEVLDLSDGCSRKDDRKCKNEKYLIQNPLISGRLVSQIPFQYGDIEIRAKLPSGDWIYPQIYLEGENDEKIVLAYARGNEHLTGNDGVDIGGSLLFAGPVVSTKEPERSSKLISSRSQKPFSNEFHVYRLLWTQDKLLFYIDNKNFGEVSTNLIKESSLFGKNLKLVLGLGVGGISDFPDNFKSGSFSKPWRNGNRLQVRKFYESKDEWYDNTWGKDSQLQIDYVRIKSL